MDARTRAIAIGLAVAVAGAAAGWWAYGTHQQRETELDQNDGDDGAEHVDVAVGEVGRLRGFPHDVEAECDQRVNAAERQPGQQILENLSHRASKEEAAECSNGLLVEALAAVSS